VVGEFTRRTTTLRDLFARRIGRVYVVCSHRTRAIVLKWRKHQSDRNDFSVDYCHIYLDYGRRCCNNDLCRPKVFLQLDRLSLGPLAQKVIEVCRADIPSESWERMQGLGAKIRVFGRRRRRCTLQSLWSPTQFQSQIQLRVIGQGQRYHRLTGLYRRTR
jgi:hypothetical protein